MNEESPRLQAGECQPLALQLTASKILSPELSVGYAVRITFPDLVVLIPLAGCIFP